MAIYAAHISEWPIKAQTTLLVEGLPAPYDMLTIGRHEQLPMAAFVEIVHGDLMIITAHSNSILFRRVMGESSGSSWIAE